MQSRDLRSARSHVDRHWLRPGGSRVATPDNAGETLWGWNWDILIQEGARIWITNWTTILKPQRNRWRESCAAAQGLVASRQLAPLHASSELWFLVHADWKYTITKHHWGFPNFMPWNITLHVPVLVDSLINSTSPRFHRPLLVTLSRFLVTYIILARAEGKQHILAHKIEKQYWQYEWQ